MQKLVAVLVAVVATALAVGPALGHNPAPPLDQNPASSENMELLANYSDGGTYRNGTDMAFWGDIALLGNLDQGTGPNASPPGGFRVMDISNPASPAEVAQFVCPGDQSDISVWEDLVVLSVDKPTPSRCKPLPVTDIAGNHWEGIRIISLSEVPQGGGTLAETIDASAAAIAGTVRTDCGSHTNTLYPDLENERLLVYVLSYPLAGRYNPAQVMPMCNAATHRKISVVEVPLKDPAGAKLLGTPSTGTTIGCHDVTVFLEKQLAAAACITETQIWNLETPEQPEIIARIQDPHVNIHHSTVFSNDGDTLVIGDELGGAAASPGCLADADYEQGGLFFYDVSNPRVPVRKGSYKLPRKVVSEFCTAHLFNVVPRDDDQDVLVSSWYAGSTSVIDFTDPSSPSEVAHWIPASTVTPHSQTKEAAAWSSYWYNGNVFANNFDEDVSSVEPQSRGLDVFAVDHPLVQGAVELDRLNPQLQEPVPTG